MLKTIAIDDEPLALEVVKSHASKVNFLDLKGTFTDAFKALDFLQGAPVDLIFLDIKMPDISGMEFATFLQDRPMVVFTTAYSEHAVKSFELDAVDYLLKPFSLVRFTKACSKANELWHLRTKSFEQDYIFIKTGYEQVKIFLKDIAYLEACGNYISFQVNSQKYLSRMTLGEAESILNPNFVRVHRSFIINKEKINKIERHQLTVGQFIVPLGNSFAENIQLM